MEQKRYVIILLLILLIALILTSRKPAVKKPKEQRVVLTEVTLVHSPSTELLVKKIVHSFNLKKVRLADNSVVRIKTVNLLPLKAAQSIANGDVKTDLWLAPSKTLVQYANASLKNLGPPQSECMQIFATPLIFALPKSQGSIARGEEQVFSWSNFFSLRESGQEFKDVVISYSNPFSSNTGFSAFLQLAYLAVSGQKGGLDIRAVQSQQFVERLKKYQSLVFNYPGSEEILFETALRNSLRRKNLILTTEQAVVEFNKKNPSKLFTIYYPKEGSYWQDYNLCISQADWVNAAKRAGIRKFIEFLRESDAQELIIQAGFRPSGIHIVGIKRSAFPEALLTQPKKHFLPAAASITKHLIELWNKVKKPLALFIAIDVSGSMAERPLLNSQSIARTLFASLSNRDLAAYYFFSTRKSKPSKFINKKEELIFAVDSATALGGSAVYDGLKVSLRKITEDYEGVLKDKRIVLLVFTDDDDKVSLTTPRALQLIVLDRTSKIPLNFIVIGIQNSSGQNWQPLQQIVKEGGGILKIVAKDDWGNVLKFIKDRL